MAKEKQFLVRCAGIQRLVAEDTSDCRRNGKPGALLLQLHTLQSDRIQSHTELAADPGWSASGMAGVREAKRGAR